MKIYLTLIILFLTLSGFAQVYVQLELFNDPKTLKYGIGDKITFRPYYMEKDWMKGEIKNILVDEKTLVLDNGIFALDEISHYLLYRRSVSIFSGIVQTFGTLWLVNGGIALAFGREDNWVRVLGISGGSILFGYLFKKAFYKVPIKLGKNNRLRIVDLRFSIDEPINSQ